MKKRTTLAFLLSLIFFNAGVEGSGHNAKYLPAALAQVLNGNGNGRFNVARKLWANEGELLEEASAERKIGETITTALSTRYAGATITVEASQAWPGQDTADAPTDLPSAPGYQFVSWVYRVDKAGQAPRYELFTAIAQKKHVTPAEAPVDNDHADQYRFLTVRVLPREPTP
jgi:hypothetical protein